MIIIEAYFDNRSFYRLGVVNIFREEKKVSSFLHHFPILTTLETYMRPQIPFGHGGEGAPGPEGAGRRGP